MQIQKKLQEVLIVIQEDAIITQDDQAEVTIKENNILNPVLKAKILEVCDKKIAVKGEGVGVSFYAFFKNKNDNPKLLMEAAVWWIKTHELDHFEKAVKIKKLVLGNTTQ